MEFFTKLTEETFQKNKKYLPLDPKGGLIFRAIVRKDSIILVGSAYHKIDRDSYMLLMEEDLDLLFFETDYAEFLESNLLNKKFLQTNYYSSWWVKSEDLKFTISLLPEKDFVPIGSLGSYANLIKIGDISPVLNTLFPIKNIETSDSRLTVEVAGHNYYFQSFQDIFLRGINFINASHFEKFPELISGLELVGHISSMRSFWIHLADHIFDVSKAVKNL